MFLSPANSRHVDAAWKEVKDHVGYMQRLTSATLCLGRVFPGAGDAADARLQWRSHADTHHGAVHGRPATLAVEAAGHRHDGQVSAAVGRTR